MSNFIGPVLPPHLLNRISPDEDTDHVENDKQIPLNSHEDVEVGPLPPHLLQVIPEDNEEGDSDKMPSQYLERKIVKSKVVDTSELIGPQLPSHMEKNAIVKQVNDVGQNVPLQGTTFSNPKNTTGATIGPTLPPKLRTKFSNKSSKISESSDEEPGVIGPALPPHLRNDDDDDDDENVVGDNSQVSTDVCVIGPRLPPFLTAKNNRLQSSTCETSNNISIIGPSLPSHLKSKLEEELPMVVEDEVANENSKPVIGPTLPSHVKLNSVIDPKDTEDMYGPALPPGFHPKTVVREEMTEDQVTESDDEDIGPLPAGSLLGNKTQHQLELRALHLREAMAAGETSTNEVPTQRESWMLELPADRAPELGLRPRQFRMREGPEAGDRSVWTDTPAERERKKKVPKTESPDRGALERQAMKQRDKIMEQLAEEHSNKRGSRSLMDMHEEKLQAKRKKAEADGEIQERRPFSREIDLQVNRFDEAQKRSILKKAQHLNDRFSSGQSKFL